jgi:hypothetical protein
MKNSLFALRSSLFALRSSLFALRSSLFAHILAIDVLVFAAVFLLVQSCSSNNDAHEMEGMNPYPETNQVEIKRRIQVFLELISSEKEQVTYRDGDNFTFSEGEWNIEALLNAQYAHSDKSFIGIKRFSDTLALTNTGTDFTVQQIGDAYDLVAAALIDQYWTVADSSKHLILVDIKDLGVFLNNKRLFAVTSLIGLNSGANSGVVAQCDGTNSLPFGQTDFWWWGFDFGSCCEGGGEVSDAAEEIEKKINQRNQLPNGHAYFTGIESKYIYPEDYPNPNANDDNHLYLLLYRGNPSGLPKYAPTNCIIPEDMNWYYCNWWDVINDCKPVGKTFISIDMKGDATTSYTTILHWADIQYGVSVTCLEPGPCSIPGSPSQLPADCLNYLCFSLPHWNCFKINKI